MRSAHARPDPIIRALLSRPLGTGGSFYVFFAPFRRPEARPYDCSASPSLSLVSRPPISATLPLLRRLGLTSWSRVPFCPLLRRDLLVCSLTRPPHLVHLRERGPTTLGTGFLRSPQPCSRGSGPLCGLDSSPRPNAAFRGLAAPRAGTAVSISVLSSSSCPQCLPVPSTPTDRPQAGAAPLPAAPPAAHRSATRSRRPSHPGHRLAQGPPGPPPAAPPTGGIGTNPKPTCSRANHLALGL